MSNTSTSLAKWLFSSTVSEVCYERMVVDLHLFDDECFSLLASKLVGYFLVVFTSLFVKLPQVLKIWRAKSGRGVSLSSQCLTMFTSCSNLTYSIAQGHPISVWGEIVALNLQNLLLLLMLLVYDRRRYGWASMSFIMYIIYIVVMLSPFVPLSVHKAFLLCSLPITATSKVIQIMANYRNSCTGQLSALSIFSMNARSFGRVFTHLVESGDPYRIAHYTMTSVLNSTLTAQIIFYNYMRKRGMDSEVKKDK